MAGAWLDGACSQVALKVYTSLYQVTQSPVQPLGPHAVFNRALQRSTAKEHFENSILPHDPFPLDAVSDMLHVIVGAAQ